MYIEGKEKIVENGWLRMCDLDAGEIFIFEDDASNIYIRDDDGNAIELERGEVIYYDNSDYMDKVVRRIPCKLVIE